MLGIMKTSDQKVWHNVECPGYLRLSGCGFRGVFVACLLQSERNRKAFIICSSGNKIIANLFHFDGCFYCCRVLQVWVVLPEDQCTPETMCRLEMTNTPQKWRRDFPSALLLMETIYGNTCGIASSPDRSLLSVLLFALRCDLPHSWKVFVLFRGVNIEQPKIMKWQKIRRRIRTNYLLLAKMKRKLPERLECSIAYVMSNVSSCPTSTMAFLWKEPTVHV